MNGKPVIANNESCGTLELVFDDVTGQVVHDDVSFQQALSRYSDNPELRLRHAQEGQRLVKQKYSVAVQQKRMQRFLNSIADHL